ncbi:YdcF family protein [Desulfovibrio sp. JC022]|uniref:YdcF family protein n=1 Tax=Desulfovibrio sp. JC022 TaxID=2593642 RepID=UPI0013D7205E|nr:YdcF family protein [Desulfovibrio sp. JC022]NDV21920.1 YdcF family protein [Desulfovibrio sp. JC022]
MKIVRPLLTLMGALTVAGILATAVLFFFAPVLLQKEDVLEKADAIVVLGGSAFRPAYAADLFLEGYAPQLLVSKPIKSPATIMAKKLGATAPYQWELYTDIFLNKGISQDNFNFFGEANISTIDEAEQLAKALPPQIKSIIIVTSPLHTRRAGIIFKEKLPNIKITVVSTPFDPVPSPWWKNYRAAPFVLLEVAKTLYYELGGAFRSSEQIAD